MRKFEIKVNFKNGYSIEEVEAKTFAEACVKIEKAENKKLRYPIGFELIDHARMSMTFEPVRGCEHDLKFCIEED